MRIKLCFALIAVLLLVCAPWARAQQDQQAQQDMMNDPAMKAMMAYATPGPAQKALQNMVGTWDAVVKSYYPDPAKPTETKGTSTYTSLLDGRFLQESVEGNFNGMPFHGLGTYGYDNTLKKYVSSWVDSMGTGIMTSEGTSPDGGKTINWEGKATDPVTGKVQTYRSVMHNMSPDQCHFEMYGPGPDGKETKMMEITYTRRK
jgi:Protein of unknown function (DUF1579)